MALRFRSRFSIAAVASAARKTVIFGISALALQGLAATKSWAGACSEAIARSRGAVSELGAHQTWYDAISGYFVRGANDKVLGKTYTSRDGTGTHYAGERRPDGVAVRKERTCEGQPRSASPKPDRERARPPRVERERAAPPVVRERVAPPKAAPKVVAPRKEAPVEAPCGCDRPKGKGEAPASTGNGVVILKL